MGVSCLTAVVVVGSDLYVDALFAPISPATMLSTWLVYNLIVAALMGSPLAILARRSSDAEVLRLWSPLGKAFAILLDLGAAASVWMLLPYASEQLRLVWCALLGADHGQLATQADSPRVTLSASWSCLARRLCSSGTRRPVRALVGRVPAGVRRLDRQHGVRAQERHPLGDPLAHTGRTGSQDSPSPSKRSRRRRPARAASSPRPPTICASRCRPPRCSSIRT